MRVHVDYHVKIKCHRYSVPYALVGQQRDAQMTRGSLELLHRGHRLEQDLVGLCAGQFACRRGHAVSYLRTHRLAEELRVLHGAGTIGKWLVQLAKTDVLILDDWAVAALIGQHTRGFAGRH